MRLCWMTPTMTARWLSNQLTRSSWLLKLKPQMPFSANKVMPMMTNGLRCLRQQHRNKWHSMLSYLRIPYPRLWSWHNSKSQANLSKRRRRSHFPSISICKTFFRTVKVKKRTSSQNIAKESKLSPNCLDKSKRKSSRLWANTCRSKLSNQQLCCLNKNPWKKFMKSKRTNPLSCWKCNRKSAKARNHECIVSTQRI